MPRGDSLRARSTSAVRWQPIVVRRRPGSCRPVRATVAIRSAARPDHGGREALIARRSGDLAGPEFGAPADVTSTEEPGGRVNVDDSARGHDGCPDRHGAGDAGTTGSGCHEG